MLAESAEPLDCGSSGLLLSAAEQALSAAPPAAAATAPIPHCLLVRVIDMIVLNLIMWSR